MGAGEVSLGASGIYVGTWGLQGYRGREGSIKGGRGRQGVSFWIGGLQTLAFLRQDVCTGQNVSQALPLLVLIWKWV